MWKLLHIKSTAKKPSPSSKQSLQNKKNWQFFILSRIPNSINTKRNHNLIGQYFSRDLGSTNLDLDTLRIYVHIYFYIYVSLVELNFVKKKKQSTNLHSAGMNGVTHPSDVSTLFIEEQNQKNTDTKLSTIKTCIWGSCNLELPGKWKLGSLLLLMQMQLLKLLRLAKKPFCKGF